MAKADQPEILNAGARTKQRDQAASELVRALLIINGGGAAALLAFLQAIWSSSSRALAKPTIAALVILSGGAVLGAAFHLFRHQASWTIKAVILDGGPSSDASTLSRHACRFLPFYWESW